jgi:hypothetical protein
LQARGKAQGQNDNGGLEGFLRFHPRLPHQFDVPGGVRIHCDPAQGIKVRPGSRRRLL